MKKNVLIFFIFVSSSLFAQNEITFTIENINRATTLLETKTYKEILSSFTDSLEANSSIDYELVNYGAHSFLDGMHQAYADHRPFVISPDIIWLLICQGFANHINYNSEDLRDLIVDFSDKKTLTVKNNSITLGNPNNKWQEIFPDFAAQIENNVGSELVNVFRDTFSTTTIDEKIAFEITLMDAMEPYFEYQVMYTICGIPEITLQGTTEDWVKILNKTKQLSKYNLDWWVDDLVPILEEFVKTSEGKIKKRFWRNMFKIHTSNSYGNPKNIDGWIVKFFPYDKNGNRIDLTKQQGLYVKDIIEKLPDEVVTVNFDYIVEDDLDNELSKIKMQFWAGFVGLHQNNTTFALTPKIGWFISYKTPAKYNLDFELFEPIIYNNVNEFPQELLSVNSIYNLTINYIEDINIPNNISNIRINKLSLNGKITNDEIIRIKKLLPNTYLRINNKLIE